MLTSNKSGEFRHWCNIYQQNGLTAISLAIVFVVIGFFVLLIVILLPVYFENYKINSHLSNLGQETGAAKMSDNKIIEKLFRRFDIDDIESVKEEDVLIEENNDGLSITIEYEVRTHAMANIDVVVSFSNSIDIQ